MHCSLLGGKLSLGRESASIADCRCRLFFRRCLRVLLHVVPEPDSQSGASHLETIQAAHSDSSRRPPSVFRPAFKTLSGLPNFTQPERRGSLLDILQRRDRFILLNLSRRYQRETWQNLRSFRVISRVLQIWTQTINRILLTAAK